MPVGKYNIIMFPLKLIIEKDRSVNIIIFVHVYYKIVNVHKIVHACLIVCTECFSYIYTCHPLYIYCIAI